MTDRLHALWPELREHCADVPVTGFVRGETLQRAGPLRKQPGLAVRWRLPPGQENIGGHCHLHVSGAASGGS